MISTIRDQIFYKIDSSLFRCVFFFFYALADRIVCSFLKGQNNQVWTRNSFYLNAIVVGISDLDISILFNTDPRLDEIEVLKKKYNFLKTFIPFLGEINLYVKLDEEELIKYFNSLELRRDPYFYSKYLNEAYEYTRNEKLTFILRMFEADVKNLSSRPQLRQKKWKSHFCFVGESIDADITGNKIIEYINSLMPSDQGHYKEFLKGFIVERVFNFSKSREACILFPHRWAVWINVNGGLEEGVLEKSFTSKECEIIQEMIRWEIMGIYTQYFFLDEDHNVKFYLELLHKFLLLINNGDTHLEQMIKRVMSKKIEDKGAL